MSNSFYDFLNPLVPGTVAKSSEVNAQLAAIAVGFDSVQSSVDRAIKLPASETEDQVITLAAADRKGYLIGFDSAGALITTNQFLANWDMNNFRLRNVPDPLAIDEPVTLKYLTNYSVSLAGLPSITGQDGPLVTDGNTVIWDSSARLIPSTTSAQPGSTVIWSGAAVSWELPWPNLIPDPNGIQGSAYWTTSLNNVEDASGYYWTNSAPLVASTFDHVPSSSGFITCGSGVDITAAVTANTLGASAGTMALTVRYYDSGFSPISESTPVSIPNATGLARYAATVTTPSLTAYVKVVVEFTAVTASAGGVHLRQMKLEFGNVPTPFTDDKTNALLGAQKAANPLGFGFASPYITLGDATATTAVLNFRSTTGSQAYDARIKSTGGTNGTVGKGAVAIESASLTNTGPIGYAAEYDAGNSGASKTIDFANGAYQKLTLSAATPAITIATPAVVGRYQIKVVQDGSVARVPTWVGFDALDCVGNALPVITTTLGGVTFVNLYWDGSQWWVSSNQWD